MRSRRIRRVIAAGSAGAIAIICAIAVPAAADPSARYGVFRSYAGVGSAVTGEAWEALTNGRSLFNDRMPLVPQVASYDAAGSTTIHTRSGAPVIPRPGDDASAIASLVEHPDLVDFARVATLPEANPSTTSLTALPLARDAVSVIADGLQYTVENLTTAELAALYTCTSAGHVHATGFGSSTVLFYDAPARWGDAAVHVRLRPVLPVGTGDVRAFFLRAIGVQTVGACVDQSAAAGEYDARYISKPGMVQPFLVSQWIAQKTMTRNTTNDYDQTILAIDGRRPMSDRYRTYSPPGALYGNGSVEPGTGVGVYARDVYTIVRTADLGGGLEASLTADLRGSQPRFLLNSFGFNNLAYLGDPTHYRSIPGMGR